MTIQRIKPFALLGIGIVFGAAIHATMSVQAPRALAQTAPPALDAATIAGELDAIKSKLTDQSHVMTDVAYHFTNLWFAVQGGHWDLANFYATETRSHLRW